MPHTKSLCLRLCPRYAPFWTAHGRLGMHFMCNLRMSSLSRSHSHSRCRSTPALREPLSAAAPRLCPPPAHALPLLLSAWQKLFKILLLGATSKCQVFTITLPTSPSSSLLLLLLLLVQFYLILMGFFLPPTAECIKQSQAHGSITHECRRPAACA